MIWIFCVLDIFRNEQDLDRVGFEQGLRVMDVRHANHCPKITNSVPKILDMDQSTIYVLLFMAPYQPNV